MLLISQVGIAVCLEQYSWRLKMVLSITPSQQIPTDRNSSFGVVVSKALTQTFVKYFRDYRFHEGRREELTKLRLHIPDCFVTNTFVKCDFKKVISLQSSRRTSTEMDLCL